MPKGKVLKAPEVLDEENQTLRQQVADARAAGFGRPVLDVQFSTTSQVEAAAYLAAGGRVVSVTKLYPDRTLANGDVIPSLKPGKRYGFADTKTELDALVERAKAELEGRA